MKIRTILALFIIAFFFNPANASNKQAHTCPSIEAIKAVGLTYGVYNGGWEIGTYNRFDTNELWKFTLGKISKDEREAIAIADAALATLRFDYAISWDVFGKTFTRCVYKLDSGPGYAFATTPSID